MKPRFGNRPYWIIALVMVLALALPLVVFADNVQNDVSASAGNDTIVAGGSTTVNYRITANNGDGQTGCNAADTTPATVTINAPAGVTATPGSLTFTACGVGQPVVFSSSTPGAYEITVSVSDSGPGTYNTNPAKFTLQVLAPPNTAPTVSVSGVTDGASYEFGSVPAATCQVTDAEDGNSSFPATLTDITGPLASYGLGRQTASCSYTDAGGLTAEASATYSIVDTAAPALSLPDNITAEATAASGAQVTFSVTASDAVDPAPVVSCSPDSGSTFSLGTTTVNCFATDAAGNASSGSFQVTVQDTTPPVITFVSRTPANVNGWNNTDVTVSWTCSDLVGVVEEAVSVIVSDEGANQSATGTCQDPSGNSAGDTQSGINIDKTAPTAGAAASPASNANGWNNTDVTVSFSGTDGLSGIDVCDADVVLSAEGAGQSASGTCTDKAGNVSALATVAGINIDKTAPIVSLVGGPADGASYYFGSVPAAPACSASDALSGLDGLCSVSGYAATVGTHTVTATARDLAGNEANASATYTVLAWTLNGFYRPVDMAADWNTVKGGSTVPLKFEVFAGDTELKSTSAVTAFGAVLVSCSGGASEESVDFTVTGGTSLRFDTAGDQFIQNWQTPKKAGACYRVTMTTQDGSKIVANFKLK